jgi:hypothetical protein
MIRHLILAAFLVALFLSVHGAQGQEKNAQPLPAGVRNPLATFTHFSATMTGGALKEGPRRVYRSGNLMRIDLDQEHHITDLVGMSTYVVHPERCTHIPSVDVRGFPFIGYRGYKVERSLSDQKETIDGHPCRIENATFTPPTGAPIVTRMKLWEAEDLKGFPIKIEVVHPARTMTVSFAEVSIDPPDPKLFKLPAKCPDFHPNVKTGSKKRASKPPTTSRQIPAKP